MNEHEKNKLIVRLILYDLRLCMLSENILICSVIAIIFCVGIPVFNIFMKNYVFHVIEEYRYELFDIDSDLAIKTTKLGKKLDLQLPVFERLIYNLELSCIYDCSRDVQARSCSNPVTYLIKYANLNYDDTTLNNLEYIYDFTESMEIFQQQIDTLSRKIYDNLPFYYKPYIDAYTLVFVVCSLNMNFHFNPPVFIFRYTSPAGRNMRENCIPISSMLLAKLIDTISSKLTKQEFAKMQRNLATPELRERIKMRDDYTCCICGNSIYKEPNLLLEVDHIIPVSKGGKTEPSNLQTLCWKCNRTKGNKIMKR